MVLTYCELLDLVSYVHITLRNGKHGSRDAC